MAGFLSWVDWRRAANCTERGRSGSKECERVHFEAITWNRLEHYRKERENSINQYDYRSSALSRCCRRRQLYRGIGRGLTHEYWFYLVQLLITNFVPKRLSCDLHGCA